MKKEFEGTITVFLSLVCIFFLCLICTVVESARIQGAKAQTANIAGIGNFSVLGEFEKPLLDEYEIFAVDGAYGSGSFKIKKVSERLEAFLSRNTRPKEGVFSVWCFDPWNLELTDSEVTRYALLTDDRGEPFYQQAVSYMRANLASLSVEALLEVVENSDLVQTWEEEYERQQDANDSELSGLEESRKEKLDQLESEAAANGTEVLVPQEEQSNPLKEIAKLRKRSTLEIVTGGKKVSDKSISRWGLPSKGWLNRGTMDVPEEYGGLLDNVLFREYLLMHFPNYLSREKKGDLDYQLEYLLGGKLTDKKNLKYVVNRLLLIREGMNYLYCIGDVSMSSKAGELALALTGFLGIPAITSATKHALLLGWAYGESLIDVRTLLEGGKVPLQKDVASWTLTLENLSNLTEILRQGKVDHQDGIEYAGYLRILLNLGSLSNQKMRALDLIECNLKKEKGMEDFEVDYCIVALESEMEWSCQPVFLSLPQVVMGVSSKESVFYQKGSIAY